MVLFRIDTASEDGCKPSTEQAANPQKSVEGLQGSTGGCGQGYGLGGMLLWRGGAWGSA